MASKQVCTHSANDLVELSVDDFGEYLRESGIDDDVAITFEQNKISGAAFLQLTEEDLKELVPLLGARLQVRQLLREAVQVRFSRRQNL